MPAPLIATLIRALVGTSAKGAALRSGAQAGAASSVRNKAVQQATLAKRPSIKNIFNMLSERITRTQSATQPTLSPSGNRLNVAAIEQRRQRESPFGRLMNRFRGTASQSAESKQRAQQAAKPDTTF